MVKALTFLKNNFYIVILFFVFLSCSKNSSDIEDNSNNKKIPTVKILEVSNILYTKVKISAQITSSGGSPISEKGICWSSNPNPTKNDYSVISTSTATLYICELSNLQINSTYHARAYAKNLSGISYGEEITFKTLDENSLPTSVEPLLSSKWSVFSWPYNAFYPNFSGTNSINGKYPAPCGPTTLSRVLGYWKGQIMGSGIVDGLTSMGDARFRLNFDTLSINYNNLPNSLESNAGFSQYKDVAKLFLAAGAVALTNSVDVATPGDIFINGLKKYFNISSDAQFAKRWEYSKEDWIKLLKKELANGRPLMVVARTVDSPKPGDAGHVSGHWYNIEGYDANNKFYIDYNFDPRQPFNGYFDVDDFGTYKAYAMVVINFKPK